MVVSSAMGEKPISEKKREEGGFTPKEEPAPVQEQAAKQQVTLPVMP